MMCRSVVPHAELQKEYIEYTWTQIKDLDNHMWDWAFEYCFHNVCFRLIGNKKGLWIFLEVLVPQYHTKVLGHLIKLNIVVHNIMLNYTITAAFTMTTFCAGCRRMCRWAWTRRRSGSWRSGWRRCSTSLSSCAGFGSIATSTWAWRSSSFSPLTPATSRRGTLSGRVRRRYSTYFQRAVKRWILQRLHPWIN